MIFSFFRENFKILLGAVITIGVLLTFLGVLALTYRNMVRVFENLFQVNRFTVILSANATDDQTREIVEILNSAGSVSDMRALSGGEVKADLKKSLKELEKSLNAVDESYFPSALEFSLNRITEENRNALKTVEEHPGVQFVINSMNYNRSIQSFFRTVDLFGSIFILLMLVSLYFTVENNIRNLFYGQMKQIEVYILFGAKSIFILKPFLIQILAVCLAAFALAVTVLRVLYFLMLRLLEGIVPQREMVGFIGFLSSGELLFSLAAILVFAFFFTLVAFYKTLRKFDL